MGVAPGKAGGEIRQASVTEGEGRGGGGGRRVGDKKDIDIDIAKLLKYLHHKIYTAENVVFHAT